MSNPPKDGSIFYIRQLSIFPCKWTPYKPSSEQVRKHGIMGRWQQMNEYGGWENIKLEVGQHVDVKFDWRPSVDDFQTMQDTITELVGALEDCTEHLEHSTPQCKAAWDKAKSLITKAKGSEK